MEERQRLDSNGLQTDINGVAEGQLVKPNQPIGAHVAVESFGPFQSFPFGPSIDYIRPLRDGALIDYSLFGSGTLNSIPIALSQSSESKGETDSPKDTLKGGRWRCDFPSCKRSYTRSSDLERHQIQHTGESPKWHCGCCLESGERDPYKTHRKDHMVQHMRKRHMSLTFERCEVAPCANGFHLIFSSEACLTVHRRNYHEVLPAKADQLLSQAIGHECLRTQVPPEPSKRARPNDTDTKGSLMDSVNKQTASRRQTLVGIGGWSSNLENTSFPAQFTQLPVLQDPASLDPDLALFDHQKAVSFAIEHVNFKNFLNSLAGTFGN